MSDARYPIAPTAGPFLANLGTYVAIYLEEMGFPAVIGDDRARLDKVLNGFLYEQPKKPR